MRVTGVTGDSLTSLPFKPLVMFEYVFSLWRMYSISNQIFGTGTDKNVMAVTYRKSQKYSQKIQETAQLLQQHENHAGLIIIVLQKINVPQSAC